MIPIGNITLTERIFPGQSCTIIKTHKQKYENYELVSGVGAERRGDGETNLPLNTKNVIRIKDINIDRWVKLEYSNGI